MVDGQIIFTNDPIKQTEKLKSGLRNKIIRIAINKASVPGKDAAISKAPSQLGILKKSIRIKSRYYRAKNVWMAIIGPNKIPKKRRKKIHKPWLYAPSVEKGSVHRGATPFLKPAYNQSIRPFYDIMAEKIRTQIEEILRQGS